MNFGFCEFHLFLIAIFLSNCVGSICLSSTHKSLYTTVSNNIVSVNFGDEFEESYDVWFKDGLA